MNLASAVTEDGKMDEFKFTTRILVNDDDLVNPKLVANIQGYICVKHCSYYFTQGEYLIHNVKVSRRYLQRLTCKRLVALGAVLVLSDLIRSKYASVVLK